MCFSLRGQEREQKDKPESSAHSDSFPTGLSGPPAKGGGAVHTG